MNKTIQVKSLNYQKRVANSLEALLPPADRKPKSLHQAMRYAVLNGGKRLRASLVYATGEALSGNPKILDKVSAVVEMVHAFSLIHDDLPALDNADLRRGKLSCHKKYGEATAILAGDALQTLAFTVLSNIDKKSILPANHLAMVNILAKAVLDLIRGEELDILMENKPITINQLKETYRLKTGELLTASILLGALASNCKSKKVLSNLKKFGDYIGLAFQIHDDIIEIEADAHTLGKPKHSDVLRGKPTYPSLLGLDKAKQKEKVAFKQAINYLNKSGINKEKLIVIARYIIERNH